MIELRWVVPDNTTTKPPVLQYRLAKFYTAWGMSHCAGFSEWQDVPTVVVPTEFLNERQNPNP